MLTTIIITKNEQTMITDCLKSVEFSDEIIVVDTGNTDDTNSIAKKFSAKIISSSATNYSAWRNAGLSKASGDWILFVDADERVSSALARQIKISTAQCPDSIGSFRIRRHNNYLGKFMNHGGWGNEYLVRLFKKTHLKRYENELHEQPVIEGEIGTIDQPLLHYSHRDLESMVDKTIQFTSYEAKLRFSSNHPPIVSWRLTRVMFTEFWARFVHFSAWRDGVSGVMDGLFQVFNMFIIYARLWELQQSSHAH